MFAPGIATWPNSSIRKKNIGTRKRAYGFFLLRKIKFVPILSGHQNIKKHGTNSEKKQQSALTIFTLHNTAFWSLFISWILFDVDMLSYFIDELMVDCDLMHWYVGEKWPVYRRKFICTLYVLLPLVRRRPVWRRGGATRRTGRL